MSEFTYEAYVELLHPNEQENEFWCSEKMYQDKLARYNYVKRFEPKVCAEIGVRYGYSTFAMFMADPSITCWGFDLHKGNRLSGGVRGVDTLQYVEDTCETKGWNFKARRINSQHVLTLDAELPPVGLFHVDGNHTYQGCFHDCVVAFFSLGPGGVLLIDDQENKRVKKATDSFLEVFKYNIEESWREDNDMLVVKNNGSHP